MAPQISSIQIYRRRSKKPVNLEGDSPMNYRVIFMMNMFMIQGHISGSTHRKMKIILMFRILLK